MKKTLFSVVVSTIFLFSSCATIFTGTKDRIYFDSNPQGAKVVIDGIDVCRTPCNTKVKRSLGDKMVEFKLKDYETRIITLSQSFNIVSVLNLTDVIGWGIDALTGSIMKYDQKLYNIELDKKLSSLNPETIEIDTENKTVAIYVFEE